MLIKMKLPIGLTILLILKDLYNLLVFEPFLLLL